MISVSVQGGWHSPSKSQLNLILKNIRNAVANHVRDYTKNRILGKSQGAGGTPLVGYSTNPLTVDYPGELKKKRKPSGGTPTHGGMFFKGGYKEYREKVGLVASRFVFFNTGDAWADWKVLLYGEGSTPSQVGFSNTENAIAAATATETRPLMFSLDISELSVVDAQVVDIINSSFFAA